jgi:predicted nucleotidyltransferase
MIAAPAPSHDLVLRRFQVALRGLYGDRMVRALLFGSKARGEANPESDYDIAIFLTELPGLWLERRRPRRENSSGCSDLILAADPRRSPSRPGAAPFSGAVVRFQGGRGLFLRPRSRYIAGGRSRYYIDNKTFLEAPWRSGRVYVTDLTPFSIMGAFGGMHRRP